MVIPTCFVQEIFFRGLKGLFVWVAFVYSALPCRQCREKPVVRVFTMLIFESRVESNMWKIDGCLE